jgi:CheY-like chemotaxis protein
MIVHDERKPPATRERNQPLTILIVEDDRQLRETLIAVLEEDGHTVTATSDGAEALDWMRSALPHVILLDMVMPKADVDGFEFITRLGRATPELRRVPIVLVSALSDSLSEAVDARTASLLNIVCVLGKPLKIAQLLTVVRAAGRPARGI